MADSFISKLITELTAKTTAADTDLVPIADSNGNFFKMTWQKMKQLLLGTKDISGVGDGTVTGAISELNTKLGTMTQLVATTTVGRWSAFNVPSLQQYRYIMFCINDGNMSQFSPVIYPIGIFKTCNSSNRTAMLSENDTIKCYACYNSDTQIGIYIGGSGRQVTAYGIK